MVAAAKVAEQEGLADDGFRVVINDGAKVRERAPAQCVREFERAIRQLNLHLRSQANASHLNSLAL